MPANKTSTPAIPKARKTAAQRREEAEQARLALVAEFEKNRHAIWLEIWMKAMRLALLREPLADFFEEYSWWTDDFEVDAQAQSFIINELYSQTVSEATLDVDTAETARQALDAAFERIEAYKAEQERKRQDALELERKRKEALAKLNDEDRRVLGLPG